MNRFTTPDPVDLRVGDNVRLRRLQIGMSQQALAEALGVSFQQVQKYEKGANRFSASRLWMAAKALNLPIAAFFEGCGEVTAEAPDPTEVRAMKIYEQSRKRVSGRPRWSDLNLADPYDAAMRQKAFELAAHA